jgi:hypothetical protein
MKQKRHDCKAEWSQAGEHYNMRAVKQGACQQADVSSESEMCAAARTVLLPVHESGGSHGNRTGQVRRFLMRSGLHLGFGRPSRNVGW